MEIITSNKAKTLIGQAHLIRNIDSEKASIKDLWADFMKLLPVTSTIPETYGVSTNYNPSDGSFTYILSVEKTSENQHLLDNAAFKEYELPASKYCKFTHKGPITPESISNLYDNSFNTVLKDHVQDHTQSIFAYEYYDRNYIGDVAESEFYLFIPIL